jgi:hypothetical protein
MTTTRTSASSADSTPIHGAWRVDSEQSHARFVAATLRGAVKVQGVFGSLSGSLDVGGVSSHANDALERYQRWRRERWWRNEMGNRQARFQAAETFRR